MHSGLYNYLYSMSYCMLTVCVCVCVCDGGELRGDQHDGDEVMGGVGA